MTRIHSYLSSKCDVHSSRLHSLGVFANSEINLGEVVAIWGGTIYSESEMSTLAKKYPQMAANPFGVYWGFYMGPVRPEDPVDDAERFNHSCDPNTGIKGQIILVARKRIFPGEEICFDYETAETTETGLMFTCKCNTSKCRKRIDGTAWKNPIFIAENQEYLSWYIQEKIKCAT